MCNYILNEASLVKRCVTNYLVADVRVVSPYRVFCDSLMERVKEIDGVYGRICLLCYVLRKWIGADFQRRYGGRFYSDVRSLLSVFCFMTLLEKCVMQADDKLKKEAEVDGRAMDIKEIAKTPLEDWIDNYDVMKMLHISRRTLQTLRSNGKIRFSKIGRKIYYRRQDIQNMLAENYTMFEIHNEYGKKREKKTA